MQITLEMLDEREAQLVADLNATHGALQDVAYWRQKLRESAEGDAAKVKLEVVE